MAVDREPRRAWLRWIRSIQPRHHAILAECIFLSRRDGAERLLLRQQLLTDPAIGSLEHHGTFVGAVRDLHLSSGRVLRIYFRGPGWLGGLAPSGSVAD